MHPDWAKLCLWLPEFVRLVRRYFRTLGLFGPWRNCAETRVARRSLPGPHQVKLPRTNQILREKAVTRDDFAARLDNLEAAVTNLQSAGSGHINPKERGKNNFGIWPTAFFTVAWGIAPGRRHTPPRFWPKAIINSCNATHRAEGWIWPLAKHWFRVPLPGALPGVAPGYDESRPSAKRSTVLFPHDSNPSRTEPPKLFFPHSQGVARGCFSNLPEVRQWRPGILIGAIICSRG